MYKVFNAKLDFYDLKPIFFGRMKCAPSQHSVHEPCDHVLIHYVERGRGVLLKNEKSYSIHEGQAFIIMNGESANYEADIYSPWEVRFIAFSGKLSEKYKILPPVIDIPNSIFPNINENSNEFYEYILVSQLFRLTAEVLYPQLISNQYVIQVKNYIEQHYAEQINIANLAKDISLDRVYLTRLFKKETGRTIQEYIQIFRMNKAHELLLEDKNVMQTALLCGYNTPDSFTKTFKRTYGLSPAEFRKRMRKKTESETNLDSETRTENSSYESLCKQMDNESDDIYMIAIDGGGTKTEFSLFKPDGTVLSTVILGTSNPNSIGYENSLKVISEGIEQLLLLGKPIKRIYAGISGAGLGNYKSFLSEEIKARYRSVKFSVDSDIMNILGLIKNNSKCIAAIIGTGSVVYGWDGNSLRRAGGWGYLIEDASSGYDIGQKVLKACYAHADGLIPKTKMIELAEEQLGGSAPDFTDKIYTSGKSFIASFCPVAFKAMDLGDELAKDIISSSIANFTMLINHLYKTGEYGNQVAISGGIAIHTPSVKAMISSYLDKNIELDFPTLPPVFGAMRFCAEKDLGNIDFNAFEENFISSYKAKN